VDTFVKTCLYGVTACIESEFERIRPRNRPHLCSTYGFVEFGKPCSSQRGIQSPVGGGIYLVQDLRRDILFPGQVGGDGKGQSSHDPPGQRRAEEGVSRGAASLVLFCCHPVQNVGPRPNAPLRPRSPPR
jgi:hypothetical protein